MTQNQVKYHQILACTACRLHDISSQIQAVQNKNTRKSREIENLDELLDELLELEDDDELDEEEDDDELHTSNNSQHAKPQQQTKASEAM